MFIQPKENPSVYDGSSHVEILFRCCTDTEGDVCVCVCVCVSVGFLTQVSTHFGEGHKSGNPLHVV
jgi:hypothetical protein